MLLSLLIVNNIANMEEDERITIISITPAGEGLKEQCKDIPLKLVSKGSPLSEKDAKQLYRLLYLFLEE